MRSFRSTLLAVSIAACGLSWAGSGHAEELIRRNLLLHSCSSKNTADLNACDGYIAGVADIATTGAVDGTPVVCIAKGVKLPPIRQSVVSYLQSHPASDGPAAPAVLDALRTLYKC
jgi:hypothetical protein